MKKNIRSAVLLVIVVISALGLTACSENNSIKHSDSFIGTFDTVVSVVAYTETSEEYISIYNEIREGFENYNKLFDIYNDYEGINNVKTINDNAGVKPVKVSSEIIEVLEFGKDMYYKTSGKVNIAFGSVIEVWADIKEDSETPDKIINWDSYDAKLKEADEHVNIEDLIIDEENSTVYLKDEDMSIDLGAIGKGFVEEKITENLKAEGVTGVLINAGGSVSVIGSKADGENWLVGIQNPDLEASDQIFKKITLVDSSMVTSGNYQRYFYADGTRYHHIIDTDTLYPKSTFASVTILADDAAVADAMSTAAFNMTLEDGKKMIENMDGYEALWIFEDGSTEETSGFEESAN